jgi:large repetitive protein
MRFFVFLFLIISFAANAQPPCAAPGGTPESSIAVCAGLVFPQNTLPNCSAPNIPQGNAACGGIIGSGNSIWYKFHCYQTGTLGFLIAPLNPLADFDWSLIDVTGRPLTDIATINLSISSNQSQVSGPTGCSSIGTDDFECFGTTPNQQFNRMRTITSGSDYLLIVTKFTTSGLEGYTLEFTGGTAGLTNPLPPFITSVETVACNLSQLKVTFSENILCNTLLIDGSQFTITNGTNTILGTSSTCNAGSNAFTELIINLQNPLSAGSHNLVIGSVLRDVCNDQMLPVSFPFFVNASPPPPTVTVAVALCQGATANPLTATGTNLLWYTTATGGTGSATAPTPSTTATGVTTNYVSQTIGGCESPRATITVTVNPTPPAPTTANSTITYCQNITVPALTAIGTSLLWYTTASGGTGSATAPIPSTTTAGSTTYYVSQTVGGCESPRTAITVVINTAPAAPIASTPITYCQGTTATGLTATGTNLLWYTTAIGGAGSITIPFPQTTTVGSTTYYVSQTVGNCESPRTAIVVDVVSQPPAPSASTPINYCSGIAATPLTASGTNLLWYTTASGGTGSPIAPTPNTVSANTVTYYVSQSIAGCQSPRAAVVVIVRATPAAPISTSPIAYCQGASATALTATGTFLMWYTVATGGIGSATAPVPSTTTGGSITYYVSQTAVGCESLRTPIVVNVTATPLAPAAPTPVTYCENATASALTATGTNLLWYTTPSAGIGIATAPIPSTTTAGTTTYYVSQSTGGCEGPRSAVVVNITAAPSAPIVISPINYCQGYTAIPLAATGSSLLWFSSPTGGTGSATSPIPSTAIVGSTTYYVSQSTSCISPRAAITVIITATPLAPIVTSPIIYCQNETAAILNATGTNLLWYTTVIGGIGFSAAPTPSTTAAGSTTYYVTQTVNSCESPKAPIVINVTATPIVPTVTSPINICQGTTASSLTAVGTNLLWYTLPSGGVGSPIAPAPSTTTLGSTNYYVSQSTAAVGGCEGPRALITVNIITTPAAPIVNPTFTYCQNTMATALTATGSNLLWYTEATGGSSSAIAPTPSTTTVGTTTYYVSQSLGTCEGPRASIAVTINSTPAAPTVPAATVNYCQGVTATALTATGTNLLWYTVPTAGTGSSTAPTPSTTTASSTSYYVSQTTGICEGSRTQVTVVVTAIPVAPVVVSPVAYCQGTTALALTTTTGTNLLWYTQATGGTSSAVAPIPSTTAIGSTTYYVSQSNNNCEGPRANIVVTVNTTPGLPTVTTPVVYCQNATTSPLIATGTNLQWYTSATGGTASTIAPAISSATAGTFTFYVAQKLGNCEGPRAAIVVNITATPAAPTVVSPINICPNDVALPLTATGTNLLWYSAATGGVGSTIAPTPNTLIFPATYTYYVSQSTSAATGSCEGPRATIVVTVDNPLQINVGLDSTICEGQSVKILPVVTPAGATYEWRANGVPLSTIDDRFIKDATLNPIDTGVYILKATLGGCSKEDTLNVNVIWKPIINAGLTKAICLDSSILLTGIVSHNSSDSISYLWSPTDSLATPDALQTLAYPTKTTLYTISFQTKPIYGCDFKGSSSVNLVVQKIDKAFAGNDTIAVKGVPHVLQGSGGLNFTWSSPTGINISNPFSQKATITLNDDAQFYLKVTDAIGCEGRDTVFIKVYNGPTYYVPNAFTPNGDGVNDIFRAIPVGMANTVYFKIFNRNGQLVFETNQYLKGWDGTFNGKQQPNGTYVWIVTGTDRDYKKVEMKGTVNLIR